MEERGRERLCREASLSIAMPGLELERLDGLIPILSIKQPNLDIRHLVTIGVKATNVDVVHIGSGSRVAEWMNATDLAEPVLGSFVAELIER